MFFRQYDIQLKRFFNINFKNIRSVAKMTLIPIVLGLVLSIVFRKGYDGLEIDFMQNTQYPELLFMCIITSIFFGLLSSISEILKDIEVIKRENLFGVTISSHILAKFSVICIIVTIEVCIFYFIVHYFIKIPNLFFADNLLILIFTAIISVSIGLFFSSLTKSTAIAYNLISILIIPQIILGGGLIPFEKLSNSVYIVHIKDEGYAPIVSAPWPARWAYEVAVVKNLPMDNDPLKLNERLLDIYKANMGQNYMNGTQLPLYLITVIYCSLFLLGSIYYLYRKLKPIQRKMS